jgi:dTDP-3-amino-3,4,6-trideoxy-alpha-D-glucopyranose N,N-dimethyltransferase
MSATHARSVEPWSTERAELYELIHRSGADERSRHVELLHELIEARVRDARSVLDVACGTGWHLELLSRWYEVDAVDLSQAMLDLASARLPASTLHLGDMRTFDLGREFDVVICLSSSIAHMPSVDDLRSAIANMCRHVRPGGVLIVEPWDFPEDAKGDELPWVATAEEPGRVVVLMETTTLEGRTWREESHFLVWTPQGMRHLRDTTILGAFTRRDHEAVLEAAGLTVEFDPVGLLGRGLFIGTRSE